MHPNIVIVAGVGRVRVSISKMMIIALQYSFRVHLTSYICSNSSFIYLGLVVCSEIAWWSRCGVWRPKTTLWIRTSVSRMLSSDTSDPNTEDKRDIAHLTDAEVSMSLYQNSMTSTNTRRDHMALSYRCQSSEALEEVHVDITSLEVRQTPYFTEIRARQQQQTATFREHIQEAAVKAYVMPIADQHRDLRTLVSDDIYLHNKAHLNPKRNQHSVDRNLEQTPQGLPIDNHRLAKPTTSYGR